MSSTILISTHSSKLLYASLLKGLALWEQIRYRRAMLADMLPDIDTQWSIYTKVVAPCIARKVAITASLSKDEKVPDETRVPAAVEITAGTVRLMYKLALSSGLTLNTGDYQWFDDQNGFRQAIANFAAIAGILIEIEQLGADLTMHRAFAAEMYSDQTEQRTPGQLTIYNECDVPLADSVFCDTFNRPGLMAGFGDTYLGWMMYSIDDLIDQPTPVIERQQIVVTSTPADDPDYPGTKTIYSFASTAGWFLAGAVMAAAPDLSAPETFYGPIVYNSATSGFLRLTGVYTDPTMPATVQFRLLQIRMAP